MISTGLSTVLTYFLAAAIILTMVGSIVCWVNARNAAMYAKSVEVWAEKIAKMRDPTTQITALSAEMTELTDSYQALLKSHKKLRSRIGMRENREKNRPDAISDIHSETDKRQLRLAAKGAGLLK
jgi:hypothetical protein